MARNFCGGLLAYYGADVIKVSPFVAVHRDGIGLLHNMFEASTTSIRCLTGVQRYSTRHIQRVILTSDRFSKPPIHLNILTTPLALWLLPICPFIPLRPQYKSCTSLSSRTGEAGNPQRMSCSVIPSVTITQVEPPGSGDALRTLRALDASGTSLWWRSYVCPCIPRIGSSEMENVKLYREYLGGATCECLQRYCAK